jgi:hypothetical protein
MAAWTVQQTKVQSRHYDKAFADMPEERWWVHSDIPVEYSQPQCLYRKRSGAGALRVSRKSPRRIVPDTALRLLASIRTPGGPHKLRKRCPVN